MYKSRNYKINSPEYFAKTANFETFYSTVLQKVKKNWNKIGNELIGISDAKMYRLFNRTQDDFETLLKMAEFIQIRFEFKAI